MSLRTELTLVAAGLLLTLAWVLAVAVQESRPPATDLPAPSAAPAPSGAS